MARERGSGRGAAGTRGRAGSACRRGAGGRCAAREGGVADGGRAAFRSGAPCLPGGRGWACRGRTEGDLGAAFRGCGDDGSEPVTGGRTEGGRGVPGTCARAEDALDRDSCGRADGGCPPDTRGRADGGRAPDACGRAEDGRAPDACGRAEDGRAPDACGRPGVAPGGRGAVGRADGSLVPSPHTSVPRAACCGPRASATTPAEPTGSAATVPEGSSSPAHQTPPVTSVTARTAVRVRR
ncbi:hypothetical protein ALMP_28710 [Streptomyces sp. A012304]|nr:hypothetical protein ALMP_28710 [Streptomyces sp. A012304]